MVDKKNPKEPDGSDLVQQNFELKQHVDNLEKLETRIMLFDEKLSLVAKEMIDMKNRQEELIQIIKQGLR